MGGCLPPGPLIRLPWYPAIAGHTIAVTVGFGRRGVGLLDWLRQAGTGGSALARGTDSAPLRGSGLDVGPCTCRREGTEGGGRDR